MSCFSRFNKKEKKVSKTLEIDEELYNRLEMLSQTVYDASVSKLVNAAIEDLIEKENIDIYIRRNAIYVTRSFLIRETVWNKLDILRQQYRVSIRVLVNTSIKNALMEEVILNTVMPISSRI